MSGLYGAHHSCLGDGHSQTGLWPQPGANPRLHPEAWGAFPAEQTSGDFLKEEKSPHKAAKKAGATLNSCCRDRGEARNHRDVTLCTQRIPPLPGIGQRRMWGTGSHISTPQMWGTQAQPPHEKPGP